MAAANLKGWTEWQQGAGFMLATNSKRGLLAEAEHTGGGWWFVEVWDEKPNPKPKPARWPWTGAAFAEPLAEATAQGKDKALVAALGKIKRVRG